MKSKLITERFRHEEKKKAKWLHGSRGVSIAVCAAVVAAAMIGTAIAQSDLTVIPAIEESAPVGTEQQLPETIEDIEKPESPQSEETSVPGEQLAPNDPSEVSGEIEEFASDDVPAEKESNDGSQPGDTPAAEQYTVSYAMSAGCEGKLSFGSAKIASGEKIGAAGVPAVELPEGYELAGFAAGGTTYTAPELAEYVPQADCKIEVMSQAAAKAEKHTVSYAMSAGCEGKLSFGTVEIASGEKIGAARVPAVELPEGYELAGFAAGGTTYTAAELAEYVPQADCKIEVMSQAAEAEKYTVSYAMSAGCEGTLSFDAIEVVSGEKIGAAGVPGATLPAGYKLAGYVIDGTTYTAAELAEYIPTADTDVAVMSKMIEEVDPTVPIEDDEGGDEADWEYPPGWAGSGQKYLDGNLFAAVEMRALVMNLVDKTKAIGALLKGDYTVEDAGENFGDVLAVYAVLRGSTDNYPYGVAIESEADMTLLRSVYWSMNRVVGARDDNRGIVRAKRLQADEAAKFYAFSSEQKAQLQALLTDDNAAKASSLLTQSIFAELSDEDYKNVIASVSKAVSRERQAVLMAALSLEGKVNYFWGGKSTYTGWDDRWGDLRTVTGTGSKTYGTARPMGLDCSGFVSWAFINAGGDKDVLAHIGNGTANQYKASYAVDWNSAEPGDLVFYKNPAAAGTNHVGIVVSVNADGSPNEIVHCSSSQNGVVVTDASGFKMVRRPYIYGD